MQAVNLLASSFYAPSVNSMSYLNYGAAVSEVGRFYFLFHMHISNQNGIFSSSLIITSLEC